MTVTSKAGLIDQRRWPRLRAAIAALVFALLLGALSGQRAQGQSYALIYSFAGGDGEHPYAGLLMDKKGDLYGTTINGGAYGAGTVFKLDSSGNETVLHSFSGSDGAYPQAGLVMDKMGNLYGTTAGGGSYGYGCVFELTPSGNETVLHSFSYSGDDGAYVPAGLVMDRTGNLYGTTGAGGAYGYGIIVLATRALGNVPLICLLTVVKSGGGTLRASTAGPPRPVRAMANSAVIRVHLEPDAGDVGLLRRV
jgi:uncharacterized repeat protein (TIGR03803 family)